MLFETEFCIGRISSAVLHLMLLAYVMLNILISNFRTNYLIGPRGVLFAYFHSEGTIPQFRDRLNTFKSGMLIC